MNQTPNRPKISVFGVFGAGNLGNECTLQSLLSNLRRYFPNPEFTCICSGPEEAAIIHNISACHMRDFPLPPVRSKPLRFLRRIFVGIPVEAYRWVRSIKKLKDSDMLVMTGTGMLGDFGILPLDLHYEVLKWSLLAKLCGCKLLFVSVGVGPIRNSLSRVFVKTALRLADYRSYRDDFSKEYLEGIGFSTRRDTVYPDLAFSLPRDVIPNGHRNVDRGTVVGVGLMTYFNRRGSSARDDTTYRTYVANLSRFVSALLERGYTVRLLIGDAVYDGRVRQDVRRTLESAGITYERSKIIDEPASSVADVLSQIAATDIVVASRFHNLVLSLMLAKPVVALSYHEKIDALMAGLGLDEFCQDIEKIDNEKLLRQVDTLEAKAKTLKLQITRKTEAYRVALDEQYNRILKCV